MNSSFEQINANYRDTLLRREAERQARARRAERFQEINEIFQAYVCAGFIALTLMYFSENAANLTWPVQGIISTFSFIFAQACGWTYIVWVVRKYGAEMFGG